MVRFLTILLLSFLPTALFGHLVRGKVTDAEGQPIPYANVYLANTTNGVVTNIKGEYYFELDKGSYTLVFQSLGYEKAERVIEVRENMVLDVVLEEEAVELETIEINAGRRDPAYAIMEQVIAEKRNYIKQFETYKCETYLKVTLEKDTLGRRKRRSPRNTEKLNEKIAARAAEEAASDSSAVVTADSSLMDSVAVDSSALAEMDSLGQDSSKKAPGRLKLNFIESSSTTHFAFPSNYKSVVHAYRDMTERRRGFGSINWTSEGMDLSTSTVEIRNPYLFYTDVSDADINFYRNLVDAYDLSDRPFISPLSSTSWKLTYKYKLEEQFKEDGRVIYKIRVTPRLKVGPYFEGHIWVVDELWALKSVNLKIVNEAMPVFDYFQIIHQYEMTEDQRWVLAREDYYYNVKESDGTHYGSSIALHSDYELDVEFPRNFFRNEIRRVEDEARDRDSSYWADMRPLTLKTTEINFIRERDSINAYHQSEEYLLMRDSMYNEFKFWDPILNGITWRHRPSMTSTYINPLIAQMQPWGVGGYRHVLGGYVTKDFRSFKKMIVSGELDYGVVNRDIRGKANVGFVYAPKHFGKVNLKYGNTYVLVNNFETISGFFARGNFVQKIYYGASHEWEIFNGVKLAVGASHASRKPIADLELSAWSDSLFGDLNRPQDFNVYNEAILDVTMTIVPRQKYISEPRRKINLPSKWPTFTIRYKKAIPDIFGSDLNYDFLEVRATDEFRPGTWGVSRWSARVGRFLQANELRFTDLTFFRGSDPFFFANPLRAFQLLGPTISTSNAYLQANYLHSFGGALLDKVPLINRTTLQTTGGGGILLIEDGNFFHSEIYGGLEVPFTIKGQRFKIGAYYVTSYSNHTNAIDGQLKFGLTFYDDARRRWNY